MTTTYHEFPPGRGDTWEDRVRMVVELIEQSRGRPLLNPEAATVNIVCDSCGRIAGGDIHHQPHGWHLGKFGEDDFCPACRGF